MKTYKYLTSENERGSRNNYIARIVFDTLDDPPMYIELAKDDGYTREFEWIKYKLSKETI